MPAEAVASPPAAPAAQTPAVHAGPSPNAPLANLDKPAEPPAPVKPGSAREKMLKGMAEKWGSEPPKSQATDPAKADPKPGKTSSATQTEAPHPPGEKAGGDDDSTTPPAPPEIDKETKKQNPWKLYREEKARAAQLERQMEEAKTKGLSESEKGEYLARVEKAEAKLKEYEQEITFKAYEKSPEYQEKFEKPYNEAWSRHMADLRGVTVQGDDGVARPMEAKDILDLVNLELPDARALAKAKWGDFADDAMSARKEIRNLFETKTRALDEARKTGVEREKMTQEKVQRWNAETEKHISTVWNEENAAVLSDPENGQWLKPVEGDTTRNQILGKGIALTDRGFSENPKDPKLTPEQRVEIIKRHAAIRNRSIGYGPLKYENKMLRQEIAELRKANGQFKASTPSTAGGTSTPSTAAPTSARARMNAEIERKWGK